MPTDAPVRVLQVLMCDGVGGTEAMVATLVERADPSLLTNHVVTLSGHGSVAARLLSAGVPHASLGHENSLPLAVRRLAGVIARGDYDVINAYGFKATVIARLLTRTLSGGARFISGVRGLHVTETEHPGTAKARVALGVERAGTGMVDIYDANSTGALRLLADAGVPERKLRYIPNGLDLDDWPQALLAGRGTPTVLCVARFVPGKRQEDLVRAAELLDARGVDFRIAFAGDGPRLAEVRALAAGGPAADRIDFLGLLDRTGVRSMLRDADVVCLPTTGEGMSNVVMEAMASGLPVVGTDVNGVADLVEDDRTGRLVPVADPEALADALHGLVSDVDRRRRLGAAGRERVRRTFTLDAMVTAKTRLYHEVAA